MTLKITSEVIDIGPIEIGTLITPWCRLLEIPLIQIADLYGILSLTLNFYLNMVTSEVIDIGLIEIGTSIYPQLKIFEIHLY